MNHQRGGVMSIVLLAVVGGAIVLYIGYSFVSTLGAPSLDQVPQTGAGTALQRGPEAPPLAESLVSFDDNFSRSGDLFFMLVYSGDGSAPKYIQVDIADAKTFRKVPVLGGVADGKKGEKAKATTRGPSFYMDSMYVYFFSGNSLEKVAGADPNTFVLLSEGYAKDANNVYVITTTCDVDGTCTGTLSVVPAADPQTFESFPPTQVPDPDGTGEVTVDAKDKNQIYYQGIWVGPLPDPDDHTLHPDVDDPVLISP